MGTNGMKMQMMCIHYHQQRELQEKGKKRQHRELKIRKEDGDDHERKELKEIQQQLKVRKEDEEDR